MLVSKMDRRVLRWCGHMGGIDEYRMARNVFMAKVRELWVWGKPRLGWMDGGKVALGSKGMTVEAA